MTTEAIEAIETAEDGRFEDAESAGPGGDTGAERPPESRRQSRHRRAEHAIAAIHGKAARIKRREVCELIDTLNARGDGELDDDRRAAIEELADAIVGRLLAVPTRSLWAAAADDDPSTIDTALELFDPDSGVNGVDKNVSMDDSNAREVSDAE